jgi:glutaredoxin
MKVEVFSKEGCAACTKLKDFLVGSNISYWDWVLDENVTIEVIKEKFPGARSFPQIMVDGKPTSFKELQELIEGGD